MRAFELKVGVMPWIVVSLLAGCSGGGKGNTDTHSCNDGSTGNSLSGSYCEDTPMMFTETQCKALGTALRIEYVRPLGSGSTCVAGPMYACEKTLQIIIDSTSYPFGPGKDVPVLMDGASVRRILAMTTQPQDLTPDLDPAKPQNVHFDDYSMSFGSHLSGRFGFYTKSGRTLNGTFDCTLQDAAAGADAG